MVDRVELTVSGFDEPVFVGFRSDGCGSVYFGQDPVYQFNSSCQLRRAYCDSLLLKSHEGGLVSLDRRRRDDEVQLVRHDLSDEQCREQLDRMHALLDRLRTALADGQFHVVGQVPDDVDVVGRVGRWLVELASGEVARRPRAM